MKCIKCGNESYDSNYCINCGASLKNEAIKYEKTLKWVNLICIPILGIILLLVSFELFLIMACAFGGNACLESKLADLINFGLIKVFLKLFPFLVPFIIIFNIILIIKIRKIYKNNGIFKSNVYINKTKYLLLNFFFGVFGIHQFAIGNKKRGLIFLTFSIIILLIISLIFALFSNIILFFLIYISPIISFLLSVSDFVLGISKIKDENGYIYF